MDIEIKNSNLVTQNEPSKAGEASESLKDNPMRGAVRMLVVMIIFTVIFAFGVRLVLAHYGISV